MNKRASERARTISTIHLEAFIHLQTSHLGMADADNMMENHTGHRKKASREIRECFQI